MIVDPDIHQGVLQGHTDVVWDLAVHPTTGFVLSCGADGSCRLWNHHQTSPQIREFRTEQSKYLSKLVLNRMVCFNKNTVPIP